jgi:hypothetical protein
VASNEFQPGWIITPSIGIVSRAITKLSRYLLIDSMPLKARREKSYGAIRHSDAIGSWTSLAEVLSENWQA